MDLLNEWKYLQIPILPHPQFCTHSSIGMTEWSNLSFYMQDPIIIVAFYTI